MIISFDYFINVIENDDEKVYKVLAFYNKINDIDYKEDV